MPIALQLDEVQAALGSVVEVPICRIVPMEEDPARITVAGTGEVPLVAGPVLGPWPTPMIFVPLGSTQVVDVVIVPAGSRIVAGVAVHVVPLLHHGVSVAGLDPASQVKLAEPLASTTPPREGRAFKAE